MTKINKLIHGACSNYLISIRDGISERLYRNIFHRQKHVFVYLWLFATKTSTQYRSGGFGLSSLDLRYYRGGCRRGWEEGLYRHFTRRIKLSEKGCEMITQKQKPRKKTVGIEYNHPTHNRRKKNNKISS